VGDGFVGGVPNGCVCSRIEPVLAEGVARLNERASDVAMKTMAHHVVARDRKVAAPRGPKAVWLPEPPNAPARSAALPLCNMMTITNQHGRDAPADPDQSGRDQKRCSPLSPRRHFHLFLSPKLSTKKTPVQRKFTIAANDSGARLAPPTSAPSISSCFINP
jgi:hypothetical protein